MSLGATFLPIFPLNLVPFEGQPVNLHIFEDRYKELVGDCLTADVGFGILPFVNGQLCEYGGLMRIEEVVEEYPDGRLDIRTRCLSRFRLLSFQNPAEGHSYAGGQVELSEPDALAGAQAAKQQELVNLVHRLYGLLQSTLDERLLKSPQLSYAIGHKIGLSLDQEYEIFLLTTETERQQYLIDHLLRALPSLEEFNRTRERIQLNGHFQKFDPLTF
jgi:Lon protease-like protein